MSRRGSLARGGPGLGVRVTVVAGALAGLLAVAVTLLVVERPVPVRAAAVPTRTIIRTSSSGAASAQAPSSGPHRPIVPPGLSSRSVRTATRHDRRARERVAAHERLVVRRLAREVAAARADRGIARRSRRLRPRRHGYNRRPRARSSAG